MPNQQIDDRRAAEGAGYLLTEGGEPANELEIGVEGGWRREFC